MHVDIAPAIFESGRQTKLIFNINYPCNRLENRLLTSCSLQQPKYSLA